MLAGGLRAAAGGPEGERLQQEIKQALRNWRDERDSASLYEALASIERDARLSRLFGKLAASEREHSMFWEDKLKALGEPVPAYSPSARTRIMSELARRFGVAFVIPNIIARELADRDRYSGHEAASIAGLTKAERGHAAVMRLIGAGRHPSAGKDAEHAATSTFSNNLRAAVLGATDGLASNFCLMMGVAGGGANSWTILLTGVAGLIAGAFSMALGEWLSVTNAREMSTSQVDRELQAMHATPDWAHHELALIYEAKGMSEEAAGLEADRIIAQGSEAIDELIRGELSIESAHLRVNALSAAAYSFGLFAVGACIPVLPFLLAAASPKAIGASIALSMTALFLLGLSTSFFTGRSAWFSGMRQLGVGTVAAAVTYACGRIFGAVVG